MNNKYISKRIWLDKDKRGLEDWRHLMEKAGLQTGETLDYTVGIYDDKRLIATGSFAENIIKCVAVCKDYQAENLLTQVLTALIEKMNESGYYHYFLYTKPEKENVFRSLGFKKIIANDDVLFMEQGPDDFSSYLQHLQDNKKAGQGAGIVMNANPFTKGHQYLVEYAAQKNDQVYVFVLSEDHSEFSTKDRVKMVEAGVSHLSNVTVFPTRKYLVSQATFPAYFLKDKAELTVARTQARLDAQIFKEKIAPVLEINVRYVGEEPYSKVTEVYNQAMEEVFSDDLTLVILPRKEVNGSVISATKVRKAIAEQDETLLLDFLPKTTYDYLEKNFR
ncbi:[citrate (pro-3S)-lyase] ligase [Tetragenococcus halophilus]|uniref:[Citrate [pro-3S]-lyase] ligase n=1 Tax=Tetragenococcus halophilus subsp. halophilus TaxID=1513897 RepID=A0A2H6CPN2_TETHA|nr:[citrate (pro-3S)-lyase] ligase [Tetragenococcus halophilus]AOF49361.1 [citrate [pro-3S]-lyase] ligase [Tetragenococcus halophilus]MCO8284536.1 [citrate (pro-3S)-lyase] ligase [Tetragenococcus halophilus]MCO8286614.1 [citrate (pro-3S)-lyase] ligase [Tetragenococcus halophilus]MCO8288243.1 [citrate (pro-3S)-lyase] ligase [Tetragenococcus halophilus]QXN86354.1 [citrate (pro-3S)-lyase] ligase [Tetragenococcus halophilus]